MDNRYEPASDFLRAIIAENVPLTGGDFADVNLQQLIEMTRDCELSNRDWATMLLAQEEIDTAEVREALLVAAKDENDVVRAEALSGLAKRDKKLALPLVQAELQGEFACLPLFEAATTIADPALVPFLLAWIEPSDNELLDKIAAEALEACEKGKPIS